MNWRLQEASKQHWARSLTVQKGRFISRKTRLSKVLFLFAHVVYVSSLNVYLLVDAPVLQLILMFMLLLHELLSLRWGPSILFSVHKSALWLYTILFSTSIHELCDFYINSVPTPDLAHLSLYNTVYPCAALHHGAVIQENSHQKPRPASRFVFLSFLRFFSYSFPTLADPIIHCAPCISTNCTFLLFLSIFSSRPAPNSHTKGDLKHEGLVDLPQTFHRPGQPVCTTSGLHFVPCHLLFRSAFVSQID